MMEQKACCVSELSMCCQVCLAILVLNTEFPPHMLAMATAKVFYLAGFSLSLGNQVMLTILLLKPFSNQVVNSFIAAAQHGLLVVNLSAPFVCRDFTEQLLDSMR